MNSVRKWAITTAVTMLLAFGATPALATLLPSTRADGQVSAIGGANNSFFQEQNGPTSGSVSVTGAVLADTGTSSASAAADFGVLGAAASSSGLNAPTQGGNSGTGIAEARWFDVLTPVANPGSGLAPGAGVSVNILLSIGLQNSALGNNASASFTYILSAVLVDLNTGFPTAVLLNDCFTPSLGNTACAGAKEVGVPGNLGPPKVVLNLTPVVLPATIGQTFGLAVDLGVSAGGATVGNALASYTASADSLDPQQTFLQPLGDFSLVAASGHDYSVPPSAVPEPSSLLLLVAGLVALGVSGRRLTWGPSMNWLAPRMRKRASSRTAT